DLCQGATAAGEHDWTDAECAASSAFTSPPIPADPLALGYDTAIAGADRVFTIRGLAAPALTIAAGPTLAVGDYTGDSETTIRLTFNVNTATCPSVQVKSGVSTCVAVITFGAHISDKNVWNEPTATDISGSPYHVALDQFDDSSIGQRDNQMQAGAIVQNPKLTLVKVIVNDNGGTRTVTDFPLTATSGPTTITGISGSTEVTSQAVPAGTYNLSETTQADYTA